MTNSLTKRTTDKTRRWLKHQLVEEVPDGLARCEFGCRRLECCQGEWETCAKRLQEAEDSRAWRARHGDGS